MQRVIKFRCWDGNNLIHRDNLGYLQPRIEASPGYAQTVIEDVFVDDRGNSYYKTAEDKLVPVPQLIIMQFTGLLDKNSKEIYEGDIVKTRVMHDYDVFSEDYYLEVKFENGQFNPMCEKKKTQYRVLPLYYDFEVVGNVHENPELMNV